MPHRPTRRTFLTAAAAATAGLAMPTSAAHQNDLAALTIAEAAKLLRSKSVSPVDLTHACLKRIERYNPALNAFITVTADQALASARAAETEQAAGKWRGPLHGIPIALKDNIDTAGTLTTAASGLFKDRIPTEDAEVVRMLKASGAISLGKLNLHEFAYGGTSTVSYFGAVHNPWNIGHISGGSSGGSACAIAADLCLGTLGTDTAGSIRMPSAYCGTVGFKPTYGRVSLRGIIPLSWSLDHCGPITKTVEDAALMLNSIAGYDQWDPSTVNVPVEDYTLACSRKSSGLRLGIPRTPFYDTLDPEVAQALDAAIAVLRKLTKDVHEVQILEAVSFRSISGVEAYAYHAESVAKSPDAYQPFTRDRINSFAGDGKSAAYANALRQMYVQRREIAKTFSTVDLLITPTMARTAESFPDSKNFDPLGTRNTSPFDVFGLPTITIPCGFSNAGLPIGLQISGAPFAESTVLSLAYAYQQETKWHTRHPNLPSA
jgi:aspartyl-tRNA(Asn)/glutamyl-tRNA(Gln) amidotransferase subunit A